MEVILDLIILLFWTAFFVATLFGVINEYQKNRSKPADLPASPSHQREDDEQIYAVGP
jgi:hypothetical protein